MTGDFHFLTQPEFIIATILTLIGIAVSIMAILIDRSKKRINYELIADTPILNKEDGFDGKVKVTFENEVLEDPHILAISIRNDGNIDLRPDDFVKPLEFNFKCTKVLSADILNGPPGREIVFIPSSNYLLLKPFLLNSKDVITFKVFVNNFEGGIAVIPQIVGVKNIPQLRKRREPRSIIFRLLLLFVSIILILMMFDTIAKNTGIYYYLLILILLIIFSNIIVVIATIIKSLARLLEHSY